MTDRLPPQALESESALLGAVLCDPDMMPSVAEIVSPGDFYAHVHEDIFTAMLAIYSRGERADKFTVYEQIAKRGSADRIGGLAYLTGLMDTVQTTSTAIYHAKIVREKSVLRGLIHAGNRIIEIGFGGQAEPDEAVREADSTLRSVTERGVEASDAEGPHSIIVRVFRHIVNADERPVVRSPWPTLNEMTGGFRYGTVTTWAARPKVGKSAAIMQLADYVAQHFGHVLYFTLEMTKEEMVQRFLSMYCGIDTKAQDRGQLSDRQWDSLNAAAEILDSRPITFFDTPKCVLDIQNAVRRAKQESDVKMVIIDHAGFLKEANQPGAKVSKHERLDSAYQNLSYIAKSEKISMQLIQHVNRGGYDAPTMKDIRDGGNLEGISHMVIFPHRDNTLGTPEEQRAGKFIVAANRSGDEGIIPMDFLKSRHLWLEEGQPIPAFSRAFRAA